MRNGLLFIFVLLAACGEDEKLVIPEGFERIGGENAIHFVYIHEDLVGDRKIQRVASANLCKKYEHNNYCEVYIWKDREKVARKLPFRRGATPMGIFEIKNGKSNLRTLY